MMRRGAQMKAPSRIFLSTRDLVSTFSRFQMPRRVCISVWQGTEKSGPCSPDGCASHADVSHRVSAMSREAMYSQALMPKPGSPWPNRSRAAESTRASGDLAALSNRPALREFRREVFTTDAHGFRNPDIVVFGDSFAAGSGVSDDETLSAQL